ncbi:hypothetical protein HYR69_11330 [Candidatus Sumerlaeota bacterium]|nr:hypothetical protein [Candidatus Sumerlaeota bacterium]
MKIKILLLAMASMLLSSSPVFACAVCFGDPGAPMVKGAKAGVLFLAVMVYGLLMAMGSVLAYWIYRARKLSELERAEAALSADPVATPMPSAPQA